MAFVKTGDEVPILNCFNSNVEPQYCPKCGKKMKLILVDEENNLVCDCEIDDEEQLN